MGKLSDKTTKNSFLYSIKRSIPILIGFFSVGVAYGIMMADAGYGYIWSGFASLFVYAGALQMLMVSFFTSNISFVSIAITSLLLNSRHIFYGLSFIEKFRKYGFWKYLLIYGMPDESYSLLCSYKPIDGVSEKQVHIFSTILIWIYWIFFSVMGGVIGQLIKFDTSGIDFALTALFIVILTDQIRDAKTKIPTYIAVLSSILCIIIFGRDSFLLPSLVLTVAVLIIAKNKIEPDTKTEDAI